MLFSFCCFLSSTPAQYISPCSNPEALLFIGEHGDDLCSTNSEIPIPAYVQVGEETQYPKASDFNFYPTKINVLSDFIINVNYTFADVDIPFIEGTSINMRPSVHLKINKSNLFCCDVMWEGIFLNQGCSITTEYQIKIEDANTAIDSNNKDNNKLYIEETTSNRNLIGISHCIGKIRKRGYIRYPIR